ncbi:aminotransferase class V-fold PLP-dependent enzyme [Streptomyces sp. NPDC094038]|uniref:aminotransferase class V-fold PLP-dependent enzyme n=1 Tax=Streptomyces sp. NPDC094038 TaxID=3366055 RepID=UPI0038065893
MDGTAMAAAVTHERAPRVESLARGQFPGLSGRTYLDTATIGLAPYSVGDAVNRLVEQVVTCPADSGTLHHQALGSMRDETRTTVARLVGARSEDIALTESSTHGLGVAAQAVPLAPGDRVLTTDLEFVQMGVVMAQLARTGVRVDVVGHEKGIVTLDAIRRQFTPDTRLVAISSVQWTTGFRIDLADLGQLCRDHGVWLLVDGAQHVGVMPMDVRETPVDILVSSGHKWLNSPFGMGFMYLAPGIRERLAMPMPGFFAAKPPLETWGQSFTRPETVPNMDFHFTRDGRAWEIGGTPNFPGAVALAAAAQLATRIGIGDIAAHSLALGDRLIEGLDRQGLEVVSPRDHGARSGIVTFHTGSAESDVATMEHLLASGIGVSVRYTSGIGGIRVSCHYFNDTEDIDALLDTLKT